MVLQPLGDSFSEGLMKFPAALLMITCTNQDKAHCDVIVGTDSNRANSWWVWLHQEVRSETASGPHTEIPPLGL